MHFSLLFPTVSMSAYILLNTKPGRFKGVHLDLPHQCTSQGSFKNRVWYGLKALSSILSMDIFFTFHVYINVTQHTQQLHLNFYASSRSCRYRHLDIELLWLLTEMLQLTTAVIAFLSVPALHWKIMHYFKNTFKLPFLDLVNDFIFCKGKTIKLRRRKIEHFGILLHCVFSSNQFWKKCMKVICSTLALIKLNVTLLWLGIISVKVQTFFSQVWVLTSQRADEQKGQMGRSGRNTISEQI